MRNVYIVGPSCGGKTSLLHFLNRADVGKLNFPIRVVSRPPRTPDDVLENTFLSKEEFETKRKSQDPEFFLSWHRLMEGERKEYYAFRTSDVSQEKVNIFSGNNALLLYPGSHIPTGALSDHQSFFIACVAPAELRYKRLKERSPEYSDKEVEVRIHQESLDEHLGEIDLVINTEKKNLEEMGNEALAFLQDLNSRP